MINNIVKSIFLVGLLAFANSIPLLGQGKCTVSPNTFTANDRITLTFDVSGTNLETVDELYLWAWTDKGDAPSNGQWTNSKEEAKMVKADPALPIFTISFVPAAFYGYDPGTFTFIGVLAKAKSGAVAAPLPGERKTRDFRFDVTPLAFQPTIGRIFPTRFGLDDIVTVIYDKNLDTARTSVTKDAGDVFVFIEFRKINAGNYSAAYPISQPAESRQEFKLKPIGNNRFALTFIPRKVLPLRPGEGIERFRFKFRPPTGTRSMPDGAGAGYDAGVIF